MKTIKKIWYYFNGKKTTIAFIGLSLCKLGLVKNNMNPDIVEAAELGFSIIGGVGVTHKELKRKNSIIKNTGKYLKDKTISKKTFKYY